MTPRFYVPDAICEAGRIVELSPDEAHHLRHVMRLSEGALGRVFDGRGREWDARVAHVARGVSLLLENEVRPSPEPPMRVVLALAILKNDYMDAAVRDAAMMGVAILQPVVARHTSVKVGDPDRLVARWRRLAIAAVKQCGGAVVPEVRAPLSVAQFIDATAASRSVKRLLAEPALLERPADSLDRWLPAARTDGIVLLVGPEGGWSREELAAAREAGFIGWTISPRTLRANAAPVAALAILFYACEAAARGPV